MTKIHKQFANNLFFTADTHFGHKNIIQFCNRPYKTIEEMDEDLIRRWNLKVPKHGTVFHIGDFAFANKGRVAEILNELNGEIILIKGNHDNREIEPLFNDCYDLLELKVLDKVQPITLCHYPMLAWNKSHYGAWMLHGHCHGTMNYPYEAKIMDVGIDCNPNNEPFNFQEIKDFLEMRKISEIDHHAITAYRENAQNARKSLSTN